MMAYMCIERAFLYSYVRMWKAKKRNELKNKRKTKQNHTNSKWNGQQRMNTYVSTNAHKSIYWNIHRIERLRYSLTQSLCVHIASVQMIFRTLCVRIRHILCIRSHTHSCTHSHTPSLATRHNMNNMLEMHRIYVCFFRLYLASSFVLHLLFSSFVRRLRRLSILKASAHCSAYTQPHGQIKKVFAAFAFVSYALCDFLLLLLLL